MTTTSAVKKMIDPVLRRIQLAISRALVARIDDSPKMQRMQISLLEGEGRDSVERFQNYGFTGHPKAGAEAVVIFPSGNRDHGLIIAVDDRRYRLTGLAEGEVAMYSDEGDYVHFKRGRKIEISTLTLTINAATKVDINTPKATFSQDVDIKGKLEVTGDVTAKAKIAATGDISTLADLKDPKGSVEELRTVYNTHHHPETETTTEVPNEQMT